MNRKDFDCISRALKKLSAFAAPSKETMASFIADEIAKENAHFDREKFLERCGFKVPK